MRGIGPTGSSAVASELARRIATDPADLVARFDLAAEHLELDQAEQTLTELDRLSSDGFEMPEIKTLRGHALVRLGRGEEAAACYARAIVLRPAHVSAHRSLAALLPQLGRGEEAMAAFDAALAACPDDPQLWIAAMQIAKAQRRFDDLMGRAHDAERRFGAAPMISGFKVDALAGLGRDDEAAALARALALLAPANPAAQATQAWVLLKTGDYPGAERAAATAARLAPLDQAGWALLGTSWRLLGDPREDWLFRYSELVMPNPVDLPTGLAEYLTAEHTSVAAPADQSLRGGTQTPGRLFARDNPILKDTAQRIAARIEERLSHLVAEPDHPFLSRLGEELEYTASWSVRLTGASHHENHIHAAGWLSSALYVSLPPEVASGNGEGALAFGVPDSALGLSLPPRRVVQPKEGLLVLFPSYLWHGTTPFVSDAARLTIAFDVAPVDNSTPGG